MGTRGLGAGFVHERVVRALTGGARTFEDIEAAVKDLISGEGLRNTLKRMERSNWIVHSQRGIFATHIGKLACLPSQTNGEPPKWAQSTYVPPPAPPRREGSDYSIYPSVTSPGQLREYRAHV
jgi:hypothetical protein